MTDYCLTYQPLGSEPLVETEFGAPNETAAYEIAADFIAKAHGRPEAHVEFDCAMQTVIISAGYWSRRGKFRLELI